MQLHPSCAFLAPLLGTWRGPGHGDYPTIEAFDYLEEVSFGHVGKPFLTYSQKTKSAATGEPMHAESGFLRAVDGDSVEFVIVQPSGIVEIHEGNFSEGKLALTATSITTTASAKEVTSVQRDFWVDQDPSSGRTLRYDVAMAAVGQPLTHHLRAELRLDSAD